MTNADRCAAMLAGRITIHAAEWRALGKPSTFEFTCTLCGYVFRLDDRLHFPARPSVATLVSTREMLAKSMGDGVRWCTDLK
jgi:hypothetical protein